MGRNIVETLMGAIVLIVAISFVYTSYKSGNISKVENSYVIKAKFREIGGVAIGSDVRLGGIKIGSVLNQYLDQKNYMAVLELSIKNDIKLSEDSSMKIASEGLLGGNYLSVTPGGSDRYLQDGGEIIYTQDSANLVDLLGKFAFGSVNKDDSDNKVKNNSKAGEGSDKSVVPSLLE